MFAVVLHRVAAESQVSAGDEPVARTFCGHTALIDARARGGVHTWDMWPRCERCRAGEP